MIFLCLAILSSVAISLVMRLSSDRVTAKLSMLSVNYLVCALLGAGYAGFDLVPQAEGLSTAVLLGVVYGVLLLGGFVLYQWNTPRNGIVLTSIFMRLGLLVPMAVSVLVFREVPTAAQILGFAIALVAIVLINLKNEDGKGHFHWQLLLMLLLCGGGDAVSKIFEATAPAALSDQFLCFSFAVAFLLCVAIVVHQKERPGIRELLFGTAIGIPNFFCSKFLLLALAKLPAVVVFPSFSIGAMLITTLSGVALFKERLGKLQWLALVFIVAALFLLNI